jgi:hypothetical protein
LQRATAKKSNIDAIEKEAFLLYLNDNIKYLSFEDSITACKKCASYYDLYNMDLCPKCKVYFKGVQYPTCTQYKKWAVLNSPFLFANPFTLVSGHIFINGVKE